MYLKMHVKEYSFVTTKLFYAHPELTHLSLASHKRDIG